ncbi:acyl-homoserine-lactone synthase [Vibrio nigripulchritudo]|uniref:Acyl-homoserine-lactone synthase n=1 Tax=Vibrio nigripulchritudo TaxID=28173 RepID=A0A9P1JL87_9VIBR|nr:acyl-homoserine-lactone synthase [Vibrio nigripulchritudo]CBJ93132.1 Autoinducer synthase [Vibrio nigripulchritudo]CCO43978.1 putative Acyl-homoserine-lactone synthase [Vibrio nigripulchritudo SFn135]
MNYLSATATELSNRHREELFRYRYNVFVNHLCWNLEIEPKYKKNSFEIDQFDNKTTVYVISKNKHDEITGCARLLPTTSPYLLETVFPELLHDMNAPKSEDIWELSRFACVDFDNLNHSSNAKITSQFSVELLKETLNVAKEKGAKHLVSVSPISIERLLKKEGFNVIRIGSPVPIGDYILVACWIDL